ncbi:MAG: peptidase domain protein [Chthoniobacter sp.]|jgi:zinc protease|nr:peptidase domain protein [Chthoniobacter sp.]
MKLNRFPPSLALLLLLLLSSGAWCAAKEAAPGPIKLPPNVERVTSVEGITEYALPNGLRVLLFPDPSRPIITVNITYKVGSRHEDYGETGMAHLLEHLVFKGTPKHPNIPQELTERGARANGTTWFDRTNYYETFTATEDNLRWALELEADRMINSHISRTDLEKEFSVVRNEFERGENSPGGVLYKRMLPAVFQWHNYGHSTIGEKSDIEGAPIERLQAFYREYYQPDNAVLVVAGRIDEQKTLELVNEYFGAIPKPARKLTTTYTKEPVQDGERQITLRRTGDVQLVSAMFRTVAGSHPDDAALSILATLLADEPSGRLYKALVETKKAASVSGSASGFAEAGIVNFSAEVRQEKTLDDAKATMLAVLEDIKKNPPTEEEVARARTRLLKNFEISLKRSDQIGLRLSESIALGDWRLAFLDRDRLEQVKAEDVGRVATTYLKPSNRTIGLFIPEPNAERTVVPEPPDIAALLREYKGKPPIAQGEDFEATPENIEKRTTRGKLENGMKFALLPKETRGDSVTATITLRFGTLETLKNKAVAAGFAGAMLDKGTRSKTRQQIRDTLDRLKARVSIGGGATAATASVDTDREHLPEVLKLVREFFREPSFPADEFDKLKQESLAALEQQKTDPQALAGNMFARISRPHYTSEDPRYTRTFAEEVAAVEALTLDQVKEFHASFYGASDATAAVVGDFDAAVVEPALREAFGDWKSPGKFVRIAEDYRDVAARTEIIPTPDKANAVYLAGFGFAMRDDDPEYPAITIGGYMLGGGFLNSRLATRIRQKEGLSYGVGGGFSASPLDKDASFSAQMIYAPQNVEKLGVAFREEIERAAREGFTKEELESAKGGWLQARQVSRSNDGALAGLLSGYLFFGRDLTFDAQREASIRALTPAMVNAAIQKHLNYARMISVRAGDFKPAGAP